MTETILTIVGYALIGLLIGRLAIRIGRTELKLPRRKGPQDKHRADDATSPTEYFLNSAGVARLGRSDGKDVS